MSYQTNPMNNRLQINQGWNQNSSPATYGDELGLGLKNYLMLKEYLRFNHINMVAYQLKQITSDIKILFLYVQKQTMKKKNNYLRYTIQKLKSILQFPELLVRQQFKNKKHPLFLIYNWIPKVNPASDELDWLYTIQLLTQIAWSFYLLYIITLDDPLSVWNMRVIVGNWKDKMVSNLFLWCKNIFLFLFTSLATLYNRLISCLPAFITPRKPIDISHWVHRIESIFIKYRKILKQKWDNLLTVLWNVLYEALFLIIDKDREIHLLLMPISVLAGGICAVYLLYIYIYQVPEATFWVWIFRSRPQDIFYEVYRDCAWLWYAFAVVKIVWHKYCKNLEIYQKINNSFGFTHIYIFLGILFLLCTGSLIAGIIKFIGFKIYIHNGIWFPAVTDSNGAYINLLQQYFFDKDFYLACISPQEMDQIVNNYCTHILKTHAFLSPTQIETLNIIKSELLVLLQTMEYEEFFLRTMMYDLMFEVQQASIIDPFMNPFTDPEEALAYTEKLFSPLIDKTTGGIRRL